MNTEQLEQLEQLLTTFVDYMTSEDDLEPISAPQAQYMVKIQEQIDRLNDFDETCFGDDV